ALANIQHIVKADKMHAFFVEAVPAGPERFLSKTLSKQRPVVTDHVMLARHVKYFACLEAFQILLERIEFFCFRKMTQVTRVQNEVWWSRQCFVFPDRFLQRADDVLVCLFVETDMAVADLHKAEITAGQRSGRTEEF